MRFICGVILLALLICVTLFVLQNRTDVTVKYLDRTLTTTVAMLVTAVYVLGMITGWTVLGFLRRSLHRVSQAPPRSN
jgi:lipopolysaccharide assembly protein A